MNLHHGHDDSERVDRALIDAARVGLVAERVGLPLLPWQQRTIDHVWLSTGEPIERPVSQGQLVFAMLRFGNSVQPGQPSWQQPGRRVVVIDHRSAR